MNTRKLSFIASISITLIFIAVFLYSFQESSTYLNIGTEKTSIQFTKSKFDLKEIPIKSEKEMEFEFKNTGEVPLIIYDVSASCDCADIKSPRKPIMPNKKSKIKITYLAKKEGEFNRIFKVYGNYEGSPKSITIKGKIKNDL